MAETSIPEKFVGDPDALKLIGLVDEIEVVRLSGGGEGSEKAKKRVDTPSGEVE